MAATGQVKSFADLFKESSNPPPSLITTKAANKMGDRKWENLPLDCLVEIFSRMRALSLVEDVQYVCKSWHEATLSPLCWKSIFIKHILKSVDDDLKLGHYYLENLVKNFVNIVIHRSRGAANVVALLENIVLRQEVLDIIGEGCPTLKRLVLSSVHPFTLSKVICKWKNLEGLKIYPMRFYSWQVIVQEINTHCKKFVSLTVFDARILEGEAYAISTLLPNIEFLSFKGSLISRSNLLTILKGCKKLVYFNAGLWRGFDLDDVIKNLAADIVTFKFLVVSDYYHWSDFSNWFDYDHDVPDYYHWSDFSNWSDYDHDNDYQRGLIEAIIPSGNLDNRCASKGADTLSGSESDYPKPESKEDRRKRREDGRKRKEKKERRSRKEEKKGRKVVVSHRAPKVCDKIEWFDKKEKDYYDLDDNYTPIRRKHKTSKVGSKKRGRKFLSFLYFP